MTPTVSVIMPTYNSSRTIRLALDSLRQQTVKDLEILVVDAGSSDDTRAIAAEYGCRVLDNPRMQPEIAKHIGLQDAKAGYAMFLDSDEALEHADSLARRLRVLHRGAASIVLTGGYINPPGYPLINDYVNTFSDPFSYFMYGISSSKAGYLKSLVRRYHEESETDDAVVLGVAVDTMLPLVDLCAGNMLEVAALRRVAGTAFGDVTVIPQAFSLLVRERKCFAVLRDDAILHYSRDTYQRYLRKLRWRVVVNTHYRDAVGVGFANREEFQPLRFRLKKYLFLPYSFTVLGPAIESVKQTVAQRRAVHLLHVPFTLYTAANILYHAGLKALRIRPPLSAYGS